MKLLRLAKLDNYSPYLLLVLTTLFWGSNFNLGRYVSGEIPPIALSFWRWVIAFLILLPFAFKAMKSSFYDFKENWILIGILSFLGVACFNSLVYLGLQQTTAVNAALMQSVCPLLIIVLASFFISEQPTGYQWSGVLLSLAGIVLIIAKGDLYSLLKLDINQGDFIVVLAVLCWALYTVLLRKLSKSCKGIALLGYNIFIGIFLIFPFYIYEHIYHKEITLNLITISSVTYVAIFPSVVAYLFWNHATSQLGAGKTGQFIHLIPVFGILLATLLLGEKLEGFHFSGSVLVAMGLLLANWKKS